MQKQQPQSQTTQVLYREPTYAEMHPKTNLFQNIIGALIVFVAICIVTLTLLRGCADDVDRQQVVAVKHLGGGK